MLRNPILPEAFDILRRAVEPGTNGKAQPTHNRRVEAERLVGMADGRAYSGGHKKAGSWLAQQLRDDGYSFAEAETALQSFRGRYPDYTTPTRKCGLP